MFCACYLQAQNFNIAERYGLFTLTLTGVNTVNNNYYFIGYGQDSISPLKVHGYFIKYSHSGDLRYIRQFDDTSGIDTFTDFDGIKWNGENFVVSAHVEGTGNANKISLFKIDTNGNYSQPKNFYDATNRNQYSNKVIISNNYTYIIGGVQKQNYEVNIRLIKLDSNFSEVWIKDFGVTGKTDRSYSATQLANGNIVIGAHRYDATRVNGTRYKEQTWIFEIDTAGNMVRQFLDPDTKTGPAKGITQTADGGFVYCGNYQVGWDTSTFYRYQNSIAKIANDFSSKDWENIIEGVPTNLIGLNDLEQDINGNIYVVGRQPVELKSTIEGFDITGIVAKFDHNGKQIWLRNYRRADSLSTNTANDIYDLEMLPNGELLMAGVSEFRLGSPNYGWILKLDENGCVNSDSCGFQTVGISIEKPTFNELEVYPNPFTSELIIEFKSNENIQEISIYNLMGSLVYSVTNPYKTLQLSHLPNGLYILEAKTENGVRFLEKILKY
jgi:hypothetical protein